MRRISLGLMALSLTACSTVPEPADFKTEIDREIRSHEPQFRECYTKLPEPRELGQFTATFAFDGQGKVIRAAATQSTFKNRLIESCVLEILRGLKFRPAPDGGVTEVNYPFRFSYPGTSQP